MEKTNIYLIGSDKTSFFESDLYFAKKIKSLIQEDIEMDAVFVEELEKFPIVKRYCLKYRIETINDSKKNYFQDIILYTQNNLDKKNLATLVSNKEVLKLTWLFKQDNNFDLNIL